MAGRVVIGLCLLVMLLLGFVLGQIMPNLIPELLGTQLSDEAANVISRFSITVYEPNSEAKIYMLSAKSPYIKILYYGEDVPQLSTVSRSDLKWQLEVGFEDWAIEPSKGDFTDVIIKVFRFYDGHIDMEVACLGWWDKVVKYNNKVILDTRTGERYGRLLNEPVQ
ncbi:MAG: hypothetical protein QXU81_00185 [Candidatus Bathyarchaeia archaeon]